MIDIHGIAVYGERMRIAILNGRKKCKNLYMALHYHPPSPIDHRIAKIEY